MSTLSALGFGSDIVESISPHYLVYIHVVPTGPGSLFSQKKMVQSPVTV